jgi:hypothetical protein
MRGGTMGRVPFVCGLLVAVAVALLGATSAGADASYHTGHIALSPVGGTALRSGFVQNIHANGPNVYAHEMYQLNGAAAATSYQVVLSIWTTNTSCSASPTLQLPTAVVTTNGVGNGLADFFFTPADADGLRGLTVSAVWVLWNGQTASYKTDCEVITLD